MLRRVWQCVLRGVSTRWQRRHVRPAAALVVCAWVTLRALLEGGLEMEEQVRMRWGPLLSDEVAGARGLPLHASLLPPHAHTPRSEPTTAALARRASNSDPSTARQNAVIYMLIRRRAAGESAELLRSLHLLHTHLNERARYPLLLFTDPPDAAAGESAHSLDEWRSELLRSIAALTSAGVDDEQCAAAWQCADVGPVHARMAPPSRADFPWDSALCSAIDVSHVCLPWRVVFAEARLTYPPSVSAEERARWDDPTLPVEWDTRCQPTRASYRHMCAFQAHVQYHPLLAAFEWYLRLDDDSELLAPMRYDPFTLLALSDKSFGWTILDKEYKYCAQGFMTHVREYRARLLLNASRSASGGAMATSLPGFDLVHLNDRALMFYNNFELGRLDFWRQQQVRDWLVSVEDVRGTYRWRWGDAPVRTAALSFFMPAKQIMFLADVTYRHEKLINYPETSLERRAWRWLYAGAGMGLPVHITFHWLSLGILPMVLAALLWSMARECRAAPFKRLLVEDSGTSRVRHQDHEQEEQQSQQLRSHVHDDDDEGAHTYASPLIHHDKGAEGIAAAPRHGDRVLAVDGLQVVGISTLVLLQSMAHTGLPARVDETVRDVASVAIPMLLCAAGMLADKQPRLPWYTSLRSSLRRLLPPYLIASILAFGASRWGLMTASGGGPLPSPAESSWYVDLPRDLLLGQCAGMFFFLPVMLYLSAFGSLVLRHCSPRALLGVLSLAAAGMVSLSLHRTYGHSFALRQMHPFVHTLPFVVGWIADVMYVYTDRPTAHSRVDSTWAWRTLASFVLRKCRWTVLWIWILVSLLSLLSVQRIGWSSDPLKRMLALQAYIYTSILVLVCWSPSVLQTVRASDSPVRGVRRSLLLLLLWISSASYSVFLYHLVLVRCLQCTPWINALPIPVTCAIQWVVPLPATLACVRAVQLLLPPWLAQLLIGSCLSPRGVLFRQQHVRASLARVGAVAQSCRPASRRGRCVAALVGLSLAGVTVLLVRWHSAANSNPNWMSSMFPANDPVPERCRQLQEPRLPSRDFAAAHPNNVYGLSHTALRTIDASVTHAVAAWEHPRAPRLERSLLLHYMTQWFRTEATFAQVKDGVLRVWTHNSFYLPEAEFGALINHRRRSFLDLVLALLVVHGSAFPDVEFSLNTIDCAVEFISKDPAHFWGWDRSSELFVQGRSPLFTVVACANSANVPVPMRDDRLGAYRDWDAKVCRLRESVAAFGPLHKRVPRAVIRGEVRACHLNASALGDHSYTDAQFMFRGPEWRQCGRSGLAWQALVVQGKPHLFDIRLGTDNAELSTLMEQHAAPDSPARLQLLAHQRSVAIIYAHGQCHWANRLEELAHMGSVVLLQMGSCQPWYQIGMRAWEHYVPVDYNWHNVTAAVEWVIEHTEEAERMVKRMRAYAAETNSYAATLAYTEQLLRRWARLQEFRYPLPLLSAESMRPFQPDGGAVYTYPDPFHCDGNSWKCTPYFRSTLFPPPLPPHMQTRQEL